jgi:hypothetical protein
MESGGIRMLAFDLGYTSLVMTLFGLAFFFFLLLVAKVANRLAVGPRWLRRFTVEKGAFY